MLLLSWQNEPPPNESSRRDRSALINTSTRMHSDTRPIITFGLPLQIQGYRPLPPEPACMYFLPVQWHFASHPITVGWGPSLYYQDMGYRFVLCFCSLCFLFTRALLPRRRPASPVRPREPVDDIKLMSLNSKLLVNTPKVTNYKGAKPRTPPRRGQCAFYSVYPSSKRGMSSLSRITNA